MSVLQFIRKHKSFYGVKVDIDKKVIHVVDCEGTEKAEYYRSVTNSAAYIDTDLKGVYPGYKLLLYGTDNVVAEYNDGQFKAAKMEDIDGEAHTFMIENNK